MMICLAHEALAGAESDGSKLPDDPARWSRAAEAVVVSDFSTALPEESLTKDRREKGKWKLLSYATAEREGWALSCYGQTGAPAVRVALPVRGWHAVYVGACTMPVLSNVQKNGFRARLEGEPVFKRMANTVALAPDRRDLVQELFLTVAELEEGQELEIAPLPGLPATVCHARLVPLTESEVAAWREWKPDPARRTGIATFDGHSWIWPHQPGTEAELRETFRGFERSDIGKWWFQVLGADLVIYPSATGHLPGRDTEDFSTTAHESFTRAVKALHAAGIDPLKVAREAAREQGAEFHVMLRPAGWKASIPYEETFDSPFYEAHPEWRCVDRDGTPTMHMSHAVPEVRARMLKILEETLELQPEGVGFLFNRGMPLMLWEEAFLAKFRELHGGDAREVAEDDPRLFATRAEIMTGFLRQIRALLDETARRQGRQERYKISLGCFAREGDNQKWGLDLPRWITEGLVDDIGVAWFAYHTSFAQPDMAYYSRLTKGSKVGVYPFIISWKTGEPQELCKRVTAFYQGGASGIAIWDPSVTDGWTGKPHGPLFETLSVIGDRERIARWAKEGVPLPATTPLIRLDGNHYSRWFPTTGF